ncbi:MAG: helix-turn-helix transcriptional regulator [Ruminococcaceae bacterium]|nr:helix-turn-helix transcriptional regulator [Oscillospiraceae bacterium]
MKRNLTQEQLAAKLGVSSQAVSKWETSETYPDGALLLPLAKELDVSLDTLFDNDAVSMADISERIISLIHDTDATERFHVARDIGWQIERGLFNCHLKIDTAYDPHEIKNLKNASYILDDTGFTMISNGKEPFFAVFPQPEEGYGHFMQDKEDLREIFAALSHPATVNALDYLYRKTEEYVFESAVLARDCGIPQEQIDSVLGDLQTLKMIRKREIVINGEARILYHSRPNHKLIALFLMAREIGYRGAYSLQSHQTYAFFQRINIPPRVPFWLLSAAFCTGHFPSPPY